MWPEPGLEVVPSTVKPMQHAGLRLHKDFIPSEGGFFFPSKGHWPYLKTSLYFWLSQLWDSTGI